MFASLFKRRRRPCTDFIVLSSQRSGSTLLCELLGSHPDVEMAKELFKLSGEGRNLDQKRYVPAKGSVQEFLEQFYRPGTGQARARGFKLMLDQLLAHDGIGEFIADRKLSVIYLERSNLLHQHVSRQAARSSQRYHVEEQGQSGPLTLVTDSLLEQLTQLQADRDELRRLAMQYDTLTLTYEDLVADQAAALSEAQRFLGLEPSTALASPLVKILDPDLNRSLSNYPQVYALLEKTGFSPYLDPLAENKGDRQIESTFIHIPKAAGSSIEAALFGSFGQVGHRTALERRQLDPHGFAQSFSFAFVRNPYDRLVSAYVYMAKGGRNRVDSEWAEQNLAQYDDFESFALALREPHVAKKILRWMHFRPQHEFLCDAEGNLMVDFLGRYETLETDFQEVAQRLGKAVQLPHINLVERDPYETYYSAASRAIVHSLYARDFELFDYEA